MNATSTNLGTNPVGRPRSFDENEVLLKAMDIFWRKGYEKTTLADLLKATGLHKGSLYQAFGDKHSLFVQALKAYVNNMRDRMTQCLTEADNALEGIRNAMYYHILVGSRVDESNVGCMALNSLVESAADDPEVMRILQKTYLSREQLMTRAVSQAQAQRLLRADWPAERITNVILAFEAGLMVELKGPLNEKAAREMVNDLLETLG